MNMLIILFALIGFVLILVGLLINKTKAYRLISSYEIAKWKGVDMDTYVRIFFKDMLFMGVCIMLIPNTLVYFSYDVYAGRSLPVIFAIGFLYMGLVGLRKSKKISE